LKTRVHLDIETYSEQDLKKGGLYKYAEHPSTELLVVCYSFGDAPVRTWLPWNTVPDDLREHVERGGEVRAHNAQFERTILNGIAGRKAGFPHLKIEQMVCTAAKAAAASLPRNLEDAATQLGTFPKKQSGKNTMRQLSKPHKPTKAEPFTRYTPENSPDKFANLYEYCRDDVLAERDLDRRVPDLSPNEQRVYQMDQRINDRGVRADLASIDNIQYLIEQYKAEIEKACLELTGVRPTQREKIADWCRDNGYSQLSDMQVATVNACINDVDCPADVKKVLRFFSTHNMKAVSKYVAILKAVCADDRLHGMFLYHGAGPGRWSSLIVQLQNLYRPKIKDCDTAIEIFKERNLDYVREMYPGMDPMKVFASCVRSVLFAPPGKDLLALDFAGIESRFTAWMFGEAWKLNMFRAFDAGIGPDSYKVAFATLFDMDPDDVTADERQIGKVFELAFGYEGGVGACVTAAETYGVKLDVLTEKLWPHIPADVMETSRWHFSKFGLGGALDQRIYLACNSAKELYRIKHPAHRKGWRNMKDAAISAVQRPGEVYGLPNKKVLFKVEDEWLVMRLPSGRRVRYFKPIVRGEGQQTYLTYMGIDTDSRLYKRTNTYGGKLTENAAQGGSSCLLRYGVKNMEDAGYPPIMTVHDEGVFEIDEGFGSLDEAKQIFTKQPAWSDVLPLAAEGWRGKRYRKA